MTRYDSHLHLAVISGDSEGIHYAHRHGADLNAPDERGNTPFQNACAQFTRHVDDYVTASRLLAAMVLLQKLGAATDFTLLPRWL